MSGIYIPGMEMPSSCNACMFDVYGLCLINKYLEEPKDELTHSCSLIPVPNHGMLIEADAAKELMKPADSIREREPEWTWGELYEIYCKELDSLPTIIPADKEEQI